MIQAHVHARISQLWPVALKFWRSLLTDLIGLFVFSALLQAQDSHKTSTGLFEVTPLVIYSSGLALTTQGNVEGPTPRLLVDSGAGYGVGLGFHIQEGNVVEFRWIRQNTYTGIDSSVLSFPRIKTAVDQFHCGFTQEYAPKNGAPRVIPFVMGGVGATTIKSELSPSSTHFSVGIGAGLKFFVNRHLGFRIDAEWVPVFIGPRTSAICGAGCGLQLGGSLVSQAEITIGPVLRF